MNKKKTYMEIANMLSLITQLGLMVLICILGCTFIGKFLDSKLNTSPILTLIFMLDFNCIHKKEVKLWTISYKKKLKN